MEAYLLIGQYEIKQCGSRVSSRQWGGALRDDPNNGCEGDYRKTCLCVLDAPWDHSYNC